ncbi:hypothetical protein B0J12DRAFT_743148 [Macrophomina phaseolina]|uniref:Uncharacterized protein n=1 Tax=Macrophomina phaseolina TaxID=35725 RepID=A0ABQ8G4R6_9PEZI|nr:hypothetical protein B0J12DRAFT_743148 [Macrophomina phaseolina]
MTLSPLSSGSCSQKTSVNITLSCPQSHCSYNWHNPLHALPMALAMPLACVGAGAGVGVNACYTDGYSASSWFSTALFTTRTPEPDQLANGQCLGAQSVPKWIEVDEAEVWVGGGMVGMGRMWRSEFSDELKMLKKGDVCI